jgi:hypothetical protein
MPIVHRLLATALIIAPLSQAHAGLFTRTLTPQDLAFSHCDGFGVPDRKSDGITTESAMFGLVSSTADLRRGKTQLGDAGIAACDQALADPRLVPAYVLRGSDLLQAKAVHQMTSGKLEEALKTLDLSDQTGRGEPLFDQSLGQGNRALRATALAGLGKKAEAEAILTDMERRRPFAVSELQLAMRVRLQFEDDVKAQMAILERQAALNPGAQHELFWMAMQYDDFPAALRYATGVSYDDPKKHGGWVIQGADIEKYLDVVNRAKFAGAVAYAQYATGQPEAAAKTFTMIRAYVKQSMEPPPAPEPGASWSKSQRVDYDERTLFGKQALDLLDIWQSNIALRDAVKSKKISEIPDLIKQMGVKKVPLLTDIIKQAQTPEPKDTIVRNQLLEQLTAEKDKARLKELRATFQDLVKMLPKPETVSMQPRWQGEGDGILRSNLNGYAVRKNPDAGSFTVRFGAATGTIAMVDEGALLAAAYHAQKEGKDGFVIDTREPIQRTIKYVGMYSGGRTENSGYEVQLVLRPVSSATAVAGDRERLIRAAEVIAALAPKFGATAQ